MFSTVRSVRIRTVYRRIRGRTDPYRIAAIDCAMSDAPKEKVSKAKKSAMTLAASLRQAGDALIAMADKADALAALSESTAAPEKKRKADPKEEEGKKSPSKKSKAAPVTKPAESSSSGSDSDSDSD